MQWLHNPRRSNLDNLNDIRRDASRYFRNKTEAYLKVKVEELETNSNINKARDLYRVINHLPSPMLQIARNLKVACRSKRSKALFLSSS